MAVTGGSPNPATFPGSETGTAVTILANAGYAVAESGGPAGYTAASSAACANASGLAPGATATCTITNDDRPVTLTLIKHVVNDSSSGSATAASFTLTVTGTAVPGAQRLEQPRSPGRGAAGHGHLAPTGHVYRDRDRTDRVRGDVGGQLHQRRRRPRRHPDVHDHQR